MFFSFCSKNKKDYELNNQSFVFVKLNNDTYLLTV